MLANIDVVLTGWINSPAGHYPLLDALMVGVTEGTIPLMVLSVAVCWWARSDRDRERTLAIEAGLSFISALLINQAILLFVSRIRPYDAGVSHLIIAPSADPSFPSDHATGAVAIVAAMWLNRHVQRALLFAIPAALLALSRVYLGTHYVSDILGGAGTAILAAMLVRATAAIRTPITVRLIRIL